MIDLEPFCSMDPSRFYLHDPFPFDGYTIATDGTILIRTPLRDDLQKPEVWPEKYDKTLTKIIAIIEGYVIADHAESAAPLPALDAVPFRDCEKCEGSGRVVACTACKGEGTAVCPHCECGFDCKGCDGHGFLPSSFVKEGAVTVVCGRCKGVGRACHDCGPVFIAPGHGFDARYLLLLTRLPNLRFATEGVACNNPHPFYFDGGDGLLMPKWATIGKPELYEAPLASEAA